MGILRRFAPLNDMLFEYAPGLPAIEITFPCSGVFSGKGKSHISAQGFGIPTCPEKAFKAPNSNMQTEAMDF